MAAQQPLTTTFTPAASCTADIYTAIIDNYYSIGGPTPSQCFPSGWASISQYFSPGICPSGYAQACSKLVTAGTVTETQATCCPTGYACYAPTVFNFPGQACASVFISQTTTTVTDASALTTLTATFHPSTEAVNGYGVSIRYQSTDFVSTTSSSTSSLSPSDTSPTASSSNAPTSSASSAPTSGLSTGAKAGIGAGVGVVALVAIIGAVIFFILRRRRRGSAYQVQEIDGAQGVPAEMGMPRYGRVAKPPRKGVHEFYTPPAELGGEEAGR